MRQQKNINELGKTMPTIFFTPSTIEASTNMVQTVLFWSPNHVLLNSDMCWTKHCLCYSLCYYWRLSCFSESCHVSIILLRWYPDQ